jgi:hypothetical protein
MSPDDDALEPDLDALDDEMERIERELERAEGQGREEASTRLRRLRRRAAEAAPDALFGPVEEDGIRGIARRTDSYGFVLIMLAALIWVFLPLSTERSWARVPTISVFFLTIIIAMHTSFVRRSRLRMVIALDFGLLIVGIVGFALDNDNVRAITDAGFAALLFVTAGVVLARVLRHNAVTSRTISGAVAAYLFVGLGFASLANGINLAWPGAYTTTSGAVDFSSMTYFSFVTLATLGYGDILPVNNWARSMATLEAVMGQIYLVTIVARLVALFGTVRRTPTDDDHHD